MDILKEFNKNIGKGVDIALPSAGLIFRNGVKGIITKVIQPHFIELDFCDSGNKKQVININTLDTYGILDEEETKELKESYD